MYRKRGNLNMGDHRLNVKISLMGFDGEVEEIDWWLNWEEKRAEDLYCALVERAIQLGLPVEDKRDLFKDG